MNNPFPVYVVPVRHSNNTGFSGVFWFAAEEAVGKELRKHDWVLAHAKNGVNTGLVQNDPILVTRKEDLKTLSEYLGFTFPLRTVIQKVVIQEGIIQSSDSGEEILWL